MSAVVDIIDAVVTRLNAATFSESFTATKRHFPRRDHEDIDALIVDVYPGTEQWAKLDRNGSYLKTYEINVVVEAPVPSDANDELEPYINLVEEIKNDLVDQKRMASRNLVEVEQEAVYSSDFLELNGLFLAVITFKFKGF